ncbi:MAG: ATP-binding protein [Desulfurococcales archaeon ex4484_42]|nr:MAG: ATP-binding protein [Desulfurococcales archaeon ex4484_42]
MSSANRENIVEKLKEIRVKVDEALKSIDYIVAVMSGKGGVGKSVISASIALSLVKLGRDVALFDADIHGPSIPWMLGIEDKRLYADNQGRIIPINVSGLKVVSIELALDNKSTPLIWRGPLKTRAILDLITMTNWGKVNYLIVDLPPGTGDEPLTIARYLKPKLRGIILVLTPGKMVAHVVNKAKNFAHVVEVEVLGAVLNMSYIKCPNCGSIIRVFGSLGDIDVNIIEELPIEPMLAKAVDDGRLHEYLLNSESEWVKKIFSVAKRIIREVEGVTID